MTRKNPLGAIFEKHNFAYLEEKYNKIKGCAKNNVKS
jgi:hypothetical protein